MTNSKIAKATSLQITDGLTVNVFQNSDYDFLITTGEVAKAYGRKQEKIHDAINRAGDKVIKGVHFIDSEQAFHYGLKIQSNAKLWTKKGFFLFCDYLKVGNIDAILELEEKDYDVNALFANNVNRSVFISQEQLTDILSDVVKIDDKSLRLSIANKLMGGR